VALCRAAGLNVDSMKVVDRSQAMFDPALLTARQFDDYIAVGQFDGKEVYLDPGEKMCPFGSLRWNHMLTSGFRSDGKSANIRRTPSISIGGPSVERVADLTIDDSGKVQGTVRVLLDGQDALHWRQMAVESDGEEVKKRFNEWIGASLPDGVQCEFDHFLELDNYESNLVGVVRVSGILGTVTGRRMFLPGLFFESRTKHPFVGHETRVIPVDVHYAETESDEVTYRFPIAYKVESSPQSSDLAWPERANFDISSNSDGNGVKVTRNLSHTFTILDSKEYGKLHEFYQKVAAADQQQVILSKTQPGKGN
jgi:hypothetical protein